MQTRTESELRQLFADRKREARQAVRDFIEGLRTGDVAQMGRGIAKLDGGRWRPAMLAASRLRNVHPRIRRRFEEAWLYSGEHIRNEVQDDLVLIRALRQILPAYRGGPLKLYRGDSLYNRKHRSYGLCWTSSKAVALQFAQSPLWRQCDGGSVLIETLAPAEAIICKLSNRAEREFLVDRRSLAGVIVLKRFDQVDFEFSNMNAPARYT